MLLAQVDLTTTNIDTQVYQVPAGKKATITIRMVNRTSGDVHVRLALSSVNSVVAENYILYNHIIYPGDVYTETVVVLDPLDYVFAQTDVSGVGVTVTGFEQT